MPKKTDILVRARRAHLRGQRVAGVAAGREYWCDPETGLLHLLRGSTPAEQPGVHADDAARLRKFPGVYEVEKRPPAAPPRRPKTTPPPPVSGESGSGDASPDSAVVGLGSPGTPISEALAGKLPDDDDEWTIKQWLHNADEMGIDLTAEEAEERPKAKLVALIRAKAQEMDKAAAE